MDIGDYTGVVYRKRFKAESIEFVEKKAVGGFGATAYDKFIVYGKCGRIKYHFIITIDVWCRQDEIYPEQVRSGIFSLEDEEKISVTNFDFLVGLILNWYETHGDHCFLSRKQLIQKVKELEEKLRLLSDESVVK